MFLIAHSAFSRGSEAAKQLLSKSSTLRCDPRLSYGVSLAAFITALALRFSLDAEIPRFPFITFIPAVILSAFLAGSRAGVLCGSLSVLAAWYWFVDPIVPFSTNLNAGVGLGLFIFIIVIDISIIEIAARAVDGLTKQQAQLNTIVETVPLGLIIAEFPSGRIVGGNQYIEEMLRHAVLNTADVHNYNEWVFFHEDGSRVAGNEFPLAAMMLRGEEHPSIDVQYQRGDGSKAWTRILGRPVRDGGGKITGGVAAFIDIDQQHKSQLAMQDALRAKEVLLYEVNHRVKNSLQLVNSFLLLEASKIVDSSARSAVMAARNKVELIARVHQILYKNHTHNLVDMQAVLEEIVGDLVLSAGRSDVNIEFKWSESLLLIIQQANPLVLVVNEIVTNCLKYGLNTEKPKLNLSLTESNDELTLVIKDNGPGIAVHRAAVIGRPSRITGPGKLNGLVGKKLHLRAKGADRDRPWSRRRDR